MADEHSRAKSLKPSDTVSLIDDLLSRAVEVGASDIHFEPTAAELVVKYRLDGVLNVVERLPKEIAANCIARLKVLGGLLTYRTDIPQEGRISLSRGERIGDRPASGHLPHHPWAAGRGPSVLSG